MITKEMLEESGLKPKLEERKKHFAANGKKDTVGRQPETIIGFLTKEVANDLIANRKPDMMINIGVTVISDRSVYFFVDDSSYGFRVLPRNFFAMTFGNTCGLPYYTVPRKEVPTGMISTVEQLAAIFYSGERHLNSIEELVDYVNNTEEYRD